VSGIGRLQSENFQMDICGYQDQRPARSTNVELRKCSEECEKPGNVPDFTLLIYDWKMEDVLGRVTATFLPLKMDAIHK
jgi:hypothetical protein